MPFIKGSGTANLYALPNGKHVVRFEDFRTTNGPDLFVYLAKHPSPTTAGDVTDGGFLSLGKLKGNVGNQNYPIPAGTDVTEYGSVVIWCELFGVLFSPAALSAPCELSQSSRNCSANDAQRAGSGCALAPSRSPKVITLNPGAAYCGQAGSAPVPLGSPTRARFDQ